MSTECSATHVDRGMPCISLRDFDARMDDITAELVAAAEKYSVFVLTDCPVSQSAIAAQFAAVKEKTPLATSAHAGGEKNSQHSTGCGDRKESYHLYHMYQTQSSGEHMAGRWVAGDDVPGVHTHSLAFVQACRSLSAKLKVCLARGLGLEDDQAVLKAHDITKPDIQTVLRALHAFALDPAAPTLTPTPTPTPTRAPNDRAGPHAGWSFLTLLSQCPSKSGLDIRPISSTSQTSQTSQIWPRRDAATDSGQGDDAARTQIKPAAGEMVCSIGDLLMYWSDDRCSLVFFNPPNSDCVAQGPKHQQPCVTGHACTQPATKLATKRSVAQLKEKEQEIQRPERDERAAQKDTQSAMRVPAAAFQAATSFSPYTGSMDAGATAAASADFSSMM